MSLRFSRRDLLSKGATLGTLGAAQAAVEGSSGGEQSPDGSGSFDSFVDTDGAAFTVDGRPTYFAGGNHPQLRLDDAWTEDLIEAFFADWHEAAPAANWIRVPAFAVGTERTRVPLMPEPGEFNEKGFVILDNILAACAEYGIRVVFVLSNYWDWNGGVSQYVDWADTAESRADFYTDDTTRAYYREYVEFLLERENTVTGVQYREDPTVAMWELMNEPRGVGDPADTVDWVEEMSSFVGALDRNHLVSSGVGGGQSWDVPEWYWDVHELDTVDAWSFHVWADSNHQDVGIDGGRRWIENHTGAAHSLSMPAYCGEFGWHVDPTRSAADLDAQIAQRDAAFEAWYGAMDAAGTNGALVWDLRAGTEHTLDWNPYAVYATEESTAAVVATWSERLTDGSGEDPARSVSDYTDGDGQVTLDLLRDAIDDWQDGTIETDLLREVIGGWHGA